MPSHRHHELGDLVVQIAVKFPDSLDAAALAPLESILPPRPELPKLPKNVHIDEVETMVDASERRTKSGMGGEGDDAMDTDEEGQGGPQVQCANRTLPSLPSPLFAFLLTDASRFAE